MSDYVPILVRQGDTCSRTIAVTKPDGSAQPLIGATLTFRLRLPDAPADTIERVLTVADPASGLATLVLTAGETAALNPAVRYEYEVEAFIGGTTTTLVVGTVAVQGDWR